MSTDLNRQPPACVRLVDIARLGAAKETHPRAVGDRLLTAVALTLVGQCSGHLLVRWEGSTFAILMEGIDPAAAADVISAACAAFSAWEMKVRDNDPHWGGSCSHLASWLCAVTSSEKCSRRRRRNSAVATNTAVTKRLWEVS